MPIEVRVCEESDRGALPQPFLGVEIPSRGRKTTLVAWDGSTPVGIVQVDWSGSSHEHVRAAIGQLPELQRLRVHPERQGQGIGTALVGHAEQLVGERGIKAIGLAVGTENKAARRMYDLGGYDEVPEVPPFVSANGLDEHGQPVSHEVLYLMKPTARVAQRELVA